MRHAWRVARSYRRDAWARVAVVALGTLVVILWIIAVIMGFAGSRHGEVVFEASLFIIIGTVVVGMLVAGAIFLAYLIKDAIEDVRARWRRIE